MIQSQSYNDQMLGLGGGMYGGMYGGGLGMMSPMMMPPPPPMGGPFSGIYQALYGLQNVVFSIGQMVHMIGMNQQQLQQAWESLNRMVEHAVKTFRELQRLEAQERRHDTEEDRQRRRRLKALRYALVFGGSYVAYKLVRNLLFRGGQRRRLATVRSPHEVYGNQAVAGPYQQSNYLNANGVYHSGYGGYGEMYGQGASSLY